MARRQQGREVNGILLLDKPLGASSNQALQRVKRLFQARKAGHTGSLDPLATGLLPLCFGGATKVSAFLLDADKHYRVRIKLGETTTTGDTEGEVVARAELVGIGRERVAEVLGSFQGTLEQLPPMYSAVKHQGERLYKLARQGLEVERTPRLVRLYRIALVDLALPEIEIEVDCSKGTYVRTLAEDIGTALGCGGHVSALRRTGVGPYLESQARLHTLEAIESAAEEGLDNLDQLLLPLESALERWPLVRLTADLAFYLRQGQAIQVPRAPSEGWVRLVGPSGELIGMGAILDDGRVQPKRLL